MRVGVLALQGDFAAHGAVLDRLGIRSAPVRTAAELAAVDAVVLPGGESTTMLRLLAAGGMAERLRDRIAGGLPVLATCAGVILLARRVSPPQESLRLLDVEVVRNAYGRQIASAVVPVTVTAGLPGPRTLEGVFIRAPRIVAAGPNVEILARRDGDPVLVRQGNLLGATFHPELSADDRVHQLFAASLAAVRATA